MFALVVLAVVAALVGALGTLLAAARAGTGRRGSRHRGGAAALPRTIAATVSLAVAAVPLLFVVEPNRLGLAAVALWWLGLPWLAVTSRLGAWAHAAWTHAVSAAALGLVDLAWVATTQQRPLLPATGVWALWLVAAAAAVAVLVHLRDVASTSAGPGLLRLRPAVVAALAVCGVGAAAASLAVQQPPTPASVEASAASPVAGSTPGATPAAPTTTARPARSTTTPTRGTEATAAARSQKRTATATTTASRTTARTTTPTTTPTTSTTTSRSIATTTATTSPLDIKIWPTNNPHATPPGHR